MGIDKPADQKPTMAVPAQEDAWKEGNELLKKLKAETFGTRSAETVAQAEAPAPLPPQEPTRCICIMDVGDNYDCPLHGMCAYEIEKPWGAFPGLCGRPRGHSGKHVLDWEIKFRRELAENPEKWDEFHRLMNEAKASHTVLAEETRTVKEIADANGFAPLSKEQQNRNLEDEGAGETRTEADAVPDLYRLAFVPGMFQCPKCNFIHVKQTLSVSHGQIGTSETDRQADQCPNDGTNMVHVTYKEQLAAAESRITELQNTNRKLNRRNQILQHSLNLESGRKSWYKYFMAALRLIGYEEDKVTSILKEVAMIRDGIHYADCSQKSYKCECKQQRAAEILKVYEKTNAKTTT